MKLKLRKPPKQAPPTFRVFNSKSHERVLKETEEDRQQKDRLIKKWLQNNKIKKIPPIYMP